MFKTFNEYLESKGIKEDSFKAMDAGDQLAHQNDYNASLKTAFDTAVANKASKDDLATLKTSIEESNKTLNKTVQDLALAMKAQLEGKGEETPEKTAMMKALDDSITEFKANGKINDKKVNLKAAALMTTANIIGIGSGSTGGNAGTWSPLFGNYVDNTIYETPKSMSTILDDVSVTNQPGTENIYWTERINEEGATTYWIAEGATKPLIDAEWKTSQTSTKEMAVRWKFTNRLLFHAKSVIQDFQQHARDLFSEIMPLGVLKGTGLNNQPTGITLAASTWVVPAAIANTVGVPTLYDVINAVAMQVRLAKHKGQIVARLNTAWEFMLQSYKDQNGNYIIPPFVSKDGKQVGSITLKFDDEIPATHVLVGVLKNFKVVISEDAIYAEGYENDDFSKNLVSRKLETYVGMYLPANLRSSIVYAEIAEVLTDIEDAEFKLCCPTTPAE